MFFFLPTNEICSKVNKPKNSHTQKSFSAQWGCKILFGEICTWRFLAFSVFTYISRMGTHTCSSLKIKRSAIHYSKLDRKVSTICFSLASDASEILPSDLIAVSRSWCWLRMCSRKAFSNLVILLGSILSR